MTKEERVEYNRKYRAANKEKIAAGKKAWSEKNKEKELEKIILSDLQIKIYSDLEKALLDLLHNSGYPGIKFEKKINFENLYNQRFN